MNLSILIIDARVVTPNRDGGSLRLFRIMTLLRDLGAEVHFGASHHASFAPFDTTLAEDIARLESGGIDVVVRPEGPTLAEHLSASGSRYDVIWISGAYTASRHFAALQALAPQASIVFDTIDLHFVREYRQAKQNRSYEQIRQALRVKSVELSLAGRADVTVVVSRREAQVLESECDGVTTWLIPNVHDAHPTCQTFESRSGLLYVGAFTFAPNVDAMTWFVNGPWLTVRERRPDIELHIVGADAPPAIEALSGPGVVVHGFVPDLAPYYARCRWSIVPLRFGAGIKGKLLSSFAHGLPALTSSVGAEGIEAFAPLEETVVDEGDWCRRILDRYDDRSFWLQCEKHGLDLIREQYSAQCVRSRLDDLVSFLCGASLPSDAVEQGATPMRQPR